MSKSLDDERSPLLPSLGRQTSIDYKLDEVEQSLRTVCGLRIPSTGISQLDAVGYDVLDVAVRVVMTFYVQGMVFLFHHQYYNKVCRRYAKLFWISVMVLLEVLLITTVLYPNPTSIWPPTWSWILRAQSLTTRRPRLVRELNAFMFIMAVWVSLMITYIVLYSMFLAFCVQSAAMNNLFETDCHKSFI